MMRAAMLTLAAVLLTAAPAPAHHGWSGYDNANEMTITGTITALGYEHPHGHVRLDFRGKAWTVTLAPPWRMERRGLAASMMAPGIRATVIGYPNRSDPSELRAERIIIGDKTFELR